MEKLKTLKDLEWKYDTIVALKQEAIKWVKQQIKDGRLMAANDFMNFFNITEEDLK